jgi:hypothetical protein
MSIVLTFKGDSSVEVSFDILTPSRNLVLNKKVFWENINFNYCDVIVSSYRLLLYFDFYDTK